MADSLENLIIYFNNWHTQELLEGSWVISSQLNHKLVKDAKLLSSFWIQPWFYPDATCSCPSFQSHSTSDKPQLLLEDLLVGHSRNIMQSQALCIFLSGERSNYYIAPGILLLKFSESFAKIRDAAFKFESLRPKSHLIAPPR